MLIRAFEYRDLDVLKILYTIFVRPSLESLFEILEKVQRRGTKFVPNLKNLAYEDRLIALDFTTLEARRDRGGLIQLYKLA
jgi:hypothetical protein